MDSRQQSILKTLLYADIFNYPLTKQEIYNFLISDKKIEKETIFKLLKNSKSFVAHKENYFFIKGKDHLIKKRKKREIISIEKLKKAKKIIKKLSLIPTVRFIGISGALSMRNSEAEDDIDIFVIAQKKFVWTTRFLLIIMLLIMGIYRNRNAKKYSDKICLNMIVDENKIYFDKSNQNLYLAHEILQLVPIFNRNNTYEKFIKLNKWCNNFLPNALSNKIDYIKQNNIIILFILFFKIIFLENILKFIQLKYMKKHITKEIVKDGFLGFHPFDYKTYVLSTYEKKLQEYKMII